MSVVVEIIPSRLEIRKTVPAGKWLCVEQAVLLETDPARARAVARQYTARYLQNAHYAAMLGPLGYGDADFKEGGSDRLVDAIVAWGDVGAVVDRVRAHHEAGADHVCIQVLPRDGTAMPIAEWKALAAALLR